MQTGGERRGGVLAFFFLGFEQKCAKRALLGVKRRKGI